LRISKLAHVVLPIHKILDEKMELARGERAVGTTKRGIGPAYADRVHRIGIRLVDFENEDELKEKFLTISSLYKELYGIEWDEYDEVIEQYKDIRNLVVSPLEMKSKLENSNVIFEGTQGVLLDIDMGTYPYVTGTFCNTTGVESGLGYATKLDKRIGIFKAYVTRVGEGPFPTELFGDEGETLRQAGREYGATTGRPRRCGWLDLPLLKYAIEISGCDEMIMTKADVLSGMEKIKIGARYDMHGKKVEMPFELSKIEEAQVEYVEFNGWKSLEAKEFEQFTKFIESETGVKISYISTGANVDQIIRMQ